MPQSKIIFEKTYENGWYKKLVRRSKPTEDQINAYLKSPNGEIFRSPKSLLKYMKNHPEFWKTFDALEINLEKEVDSTTKLGDDTWLLIDFLDEKQSEMAFGKSRFTDNPITPSEERSEVTAPPGKCRNKRQLNSYSPHKKIKIKTTLKSFDTKKSVIEAPDLGMRSVVTNATAAARATASVSMNNLMMLSAASTEVGNETSVTVGRPSPVSMVALEMVSSAVPTRYAPNIMSTSSKLLSPTSESSSSGSGAATKIKTMVSSKSPSSSSSNTQNNEVAQNQLISQDRERFKYSDLKRPACEPLDKVACSANSENPSLTELLKNPSNSSITIHVPPLMPSK